MAAMRLVLVRHGFAGTKEGWSGDDRLRPLSPRGRRQAEYLAHEIAPMTPLHLSSSPYVRCLETLAPLAARTGLAVEEDDALVPDCGARALTSLRRRASGETAGPDVLCTHGEVMGAVLEALASEDGLKLGRRTPGLKGCAWLLDFAQGRAVAARYVAPAR
jgi:8-oxo-dGTP diphosphatase